MQPRHSSHRRKRGYRHVVTAIFTVILLLSGRYSGAEESGGKSAASALNGAGAMPLRETPPQHEPIELPPILPPALLMPSAQPSAPAAAPSLPQAPSPAPAAASPSLPLPDRAETQRLESLFGALEIPAEPVSPPRPPSGVSGITQFPTGFGGNTVMPSPAPVPVSTAVPDAAGSPQEPTAYRRWMTTGASFSLDNEPLANLLKTFCSLQGVAVNVSPRITGTVSGKFEFADPASFLDLLCQNKNLIWYFDGAMAHFYDRGEAESLVLQLHRQELGYFRQTLIDLGVYDPRYELRAADQGNLILVMGPPLYVRLIDSIYAKYKQSAAEEYILEIFPLKNSWATDQSINFMNKELTVPGVAATLQSIVLGAEGGTPSTPGDNLLTKLKGTGMVGRQKEEGEAAAPAVLTSSAPAPGNEGGPRILPDSRQNAILIWDRRSRMPQYADLIKKLDRPARLIEIRAAIIDVETNRSRELGFSYDYFEAQFLPGKGRTLEKWSGVNTGTTTAPVDFSNTVNNGLSFSTVYTSGIDSLMAKVSMLESDGDANILSRPAVLTIDNTQAVIEHTETFYVKLQGQEEVDLVDITSGTVLRVTPHIIDPDHDAESTKVKLVVHVEDGSDRSEASVQVDNIPRVKKSTISTQAIVTEGQALVIGGHYNETKQTSESGVPVMKNLPMIGSLFKSSSATRSKTERLFVLSPRIVSLDQLPKYDGTVMQKQLDASPARDSLQKDAAPEKEAGATKKLFRDVFIHGNRDD